jgi:ribosomal-protein-alanine acetyltransferase
LDRIFLRPKWLVPWKRDRSDFPESIEKIAGLPATGRPAVAVVTPYFPFPLSHGGAVRMYNLLREMAAEFDIFLFAFRDRETDADLHPMLALCTQVFLVGKPRYREPRWSTLLPPEVCEFRSKALSAELQRARVEHKIRLVQVEYTALAPYRGDVLVEHDVTFALYRQVWERTRSVSTWWDYWRWRRFESRWVKKYPALTVMSDEDRKLLNSINAHVIPNGVDLQRFAPQPEIAGARLLFVGSFRHFPNIVAFQFFYNEVWPQLAASELIAVAGPDPLLYWRQYTGQNELPYGERIRILGFTADVRPLYAESNIVVVPTLESAGTNLKVLEALAMERAVVSTTTGCQGLGLTHGENVWIADTAAEFAQGISRLLADAQLRVRIAAAGHEHVQQFDWKQIGTMQNQLLRSLIPPVDVTLRPLKPADVARVLEIERVAFSAQQWSAEDFRNFNTTVAVVDQTIAGFLVSRQLVPGEREILNVAVHPQYLRRGVAQKLIRAELARCPGTHFLEVRESNSPARRLYERLGFEQTGRRPEYYDNPTEAGIVMRIFS